MHGILWAGYILPGGTLVDTAGDPCIHIAIHPIMCCSSTEEPATYNLTDFIYNNNNNHVGQNDVTYVHFHA